MTKSREPQELANLLWYSIHKQMTFQDHFELELSIFMVSLLTSWFACDFWISRKLIEKRKDHFESEFSSIQLCVPVQSLEILESTINSYKKVFPEIIIFEGLPRTQDCKPNSLIIGIVIIFSNVNWAVLQQHFHINKSFQLRICMLKP